MALLSSIVIKVGEIGIKAGLKNWSQQKPVSQAVDRTQEHFNSQVENLAFALRQWCDRADFASLHDNIRSGKRPHLAEEIVASFVDQLAL